VEAEALIVVLENLVALVEVKEDQVHLDLVLELLDKEIMVEVKIIVMEVVVAVLVL
jgi:hypothetical protein